jgi:hypothetical protein
VHDLRLPALINQIPYMDERLETFLPDHPMGAQAGQFDLRWNNKSPFFVIFINTVHFA